MIKDKDLMLFWRAMTAGRFWWRQRRLRGTAVFEGGSEADSPQTGETEGRHEPSPRRRGAGAGDC
jgi:hypothetical protein